MGKTEQDEGGRQKIKAVLGEPDGKGQTSQAETGQDEGQLSAEGIGQGRGYRPAVGEFCFHWTDFSRLFI